MTHDIHKWEKLHAACARYLEGAKWPAPVEHTYSLDGPRYRSLIACEAILDHLSREVLASLHLMEPLARREFGNTNYNILITTAERAREVLAQSEAAFKDKNS